MNNPSLAVVFSKGASFDAKTAKVVKIRILIISITLITLKF